jgi:hypothetical protein
MKNRISLLGALAFSMLLPQFMATSIAASLDPPDAAAQTPAKQGKQPAMNLKSLETQLKETKAIGAFTKLALKNQVDELVVQFREFYQGQRQTTLDDLRRPYDLLLLKVLALLQDADPQLASTIAASREDIWAVLADPAQFASI